MKVFVCMNSIPLEILQTLGHLEIIKSISSAGADGIEIRRELLGPDDSLKELGALCRELNLDIYYSAPECLIGPHYQMDEQRFKQLAREADELGAELLKLPLGHYHFTETDMTQVNKVLVEEMQSHSGLKITIENDQTLEGGNLNRIAHFLNRSEKLDIPIRLTFDMGNWLYTDEVPMKAAQELGRYVVYVHLKQVKREKEEWITEPISLPLQSDVNELLERLSGTYPRAIEFPVTLENVATYISHMKMEQGVNHERA
ncbi:TIM barrel protein [Peribacillus sp. R9-11]|uniref:sugar phosphate isomerase/epimerase family protein n=1 Tax=Peribacillus sp. R9-11 TaxID=3073271 RepID=UPI00286951DE|nr:TIM barrel protein [Peribacillus sp. R9-11]WMX55002.1 TIM barrel protein [Peribacillus sp. R9-11]